MTRTPPDPQAQDGPAPTLLEREAETAALRDLFAHAAAGRGGTVLVEGAPGLGKSALLAHAVQLARDAGLFVARARGHELEQGFGWGAARALLERPVAACTDAERDELLAGPASPARAVLDPAVEPTSSPGETTGFAVLHALHWVALRLAERAPTALLVDDAHWADEPSLRFLAYLAGRISDEPVAIVVAGRSGEQGPGELLTLLADDPGTQALSLAPLGPAAIETLVRRGAADADDAFCARCFELTRGNPLQVRELLAALDELGGRADASALTAATASAARSLGRSVLRRLGTLSAEAQALAYAVAVLEDAPLSLAAALAAITLGRAPSAADELTQADVLRPGDPLGFTHPLLRAAVQAGLPTAERGRMHRRAAKLLHDAGGHEDVVSAHLLQSPAAGDVTVVRLLRGAAGTALARGAPGSAADYLERALREPPPEGERAALLGELGRAEAAAGRAGAAEHLAAAVDATADPRGRLRLLLDLGRALQHAGAMSDATATFQRGLDEVRPGAGELATDLEAGYLAAAMHAPERAVDAHRRADVIVAEDLRETPAERALLCNAMMMRFFAGLPRQEVLAVVHRLYAGGALVEESDEDPTTLMQVIGVLSWSDEYREADTALRSAFAAAGRRGSVFTFAMASQVRARQALRTGPVGDAVADARVAVDAWRGGQQAYVHAAAYCLVAALLDGDEAVEAAAALAQAERGSHHVSAWRHMSVGLLAAHEERHEDALDAFLAAGRRLDAILVTNPTVMPWRSEAGLAARRLGREAQARELIGAELRLAERYGSPYAIGLARTAAGLLERGEDAVLRLRAAAQSLGAVGAPIAQARAVAHLGGATRRAGRAVEARGVLREAVALAERAGAAAVAREARAELRLAGGRAPAASLVGDGLTPSERRVAERAAAGESNREIAAALFITIKAVEWHLGNTYRKLAVRGRGELAEALGLA